MARPSLRLSMWGALLASATTVAALIVANSAPAKLTGEFTAFQQCPRKNPEVRRCFHATLEGGEVAIGNAKVPLVNPVTIQGGFTEVREALSPLYGAVGGPTLARVPQPIPGGLSSLISQNKSPALVEALSKTLIDKGYDDVYSTLELAGPPGEVRLSLQNIGGGEGVGVRLPVKVHLENPLLGKRCYIGSDANPIVLELTTGVTSPPPPNQPISGFTGEIEFLEEARILRSANAVFVDNAWAVPRANGCGGVLAFLVNPLLNEQMGLPSPAGRNTATLETTSMITTAFVLKEDDEENP